MGWAWSVKALSKWLTPRGQSCILVTHSRSGPTFPYNLYYLWDVFFLWIDFLYDPKIFLNLMFNRKKKKKFWGQLDKNISQTPLKMSRKYNTLLLIHVFKTNLFKNFFFLKKNYDTRHKKKKISVRAKRVMKLVYIYTFSKT